MPASNSLVTLDHAKHWAKRLAKTKPTISTLAQAHEAVAGMLGHASWHALSQFYSAGDAPATEGATDANSSCDNAAAKDPLFAPLLALINRRYPGLNAEMVEVMAIESEDIEGGGDAIEMRKRELEDEGYFSEDALGKAIEELTVRTHAPPGHSMIRVRDGNNKATLVVVSSEDYLRAMPMPQRRVDTI